MNKNIISLITAIIFSILFFKQQLGLNMLLFSILSIFLLVYVYPSKFTAPKVVFYAIFYLLSASFIFFYNSVLVLITYSISFFILLGSVVESKSSIYIQILNGFYSTIASVFTRQMLQFQQETTAVKKRKINYVYWLKMIGIPLAVMSIFIVLYQNANPYFDQIIKKIDLNFINMQWLLFTVLGYFLIINIINPLEIETLTELDLKTPNNLSKKESINQSKESLIQENQLGIVLLIVLNSLIAFFLLTDMFYLYNLTNLRAPDLSKAVHEGIYALIVSIVFAISIILYFFRGNLNFFTKNKNLRLLTFTWIALNVVLVCITSYKNYMYIIQYGFTYKRIGVSVYLVLALIGLITTFIKVNKIYNLWYLLRKNIQIAYVLLVISTTINWDYFITKYNTEFALTTDIDYLIQLSYNNTFLLKEYSENYPNKQSYIEKEHIKEKYQGYLEKLEQNNWQEFVYDNLKLEK